MKCPMRKKWFAEDEIAQKDDPMVEDFGDCIKDQCAWWDHTNDDCSIKSIARNLRYINEAM